MNLPLNLPAQPRDLALAELAHELRNPLSAIGLAASVLEAHVAQDQRCGLLLGAIASNVALAARMVEDLLQHSQVNAEGFHLERAPCRLGEQLRQAISIAARQMGQPERTVAVQMPEGDIVLRVDPMRMQQVFVNLVANAMRYTPSPGRIQVTARLQDMQVLVEVADEGVGIEPHRLATLFDSGTLPRLSGSKLGLGIGLSVVKRIVERHGGSVRACSEGSGRGSCFTVALPHVD